MNPGDPIMTVKDLGHEYGDRVIFSDLTFGLLWGAKIGIIGRNGQGKSTMLKVLGLQEKPSYGTIVPKKGLTVGYVGQEPKLDPARRSARTSRRVSRGSTTSSRSSTRSTRSSADAHRRGDEEPLEEQSRSSPSSTRRTRWEVDRTLEIAMTALACPAGDAQRRQALGRREAPRRALQGPHESPGPLDPRRAHEPPRRRDHRVARDFPRRLQRQLHPRHARPLLPRPRRQSHAGDRQRADPRPTRATTRTTSRPRRSRPRSTSATQTTARDHPRARARMDPPDAPPRDDPSQGAHQELRNAPRGT